MLKTCPYCNQEDKDHAPNRRKCKECVAQHYKNWRKKNPEKVRANQKKNIRTIKTRFRSAKRSSLVRGIDWKLSLEGYCTLIESECYYCDGYFGRVETGSGLDRIDNTKGYESNNIVSCCWTCNKIKNDTLTMEETKAAVKLIVSMRRRQ